MNIPVVTESFTPPQLLSTIDFEAFGNANGYATSVSLFAPGGFTTTYAGDAFTMFGGELSSAAAGGFYQPGAAGGADIPLNPTAQAVFSRVYENTKSLQSPLAPVIFYGASALAGVGGEEFATGGAGYDAL